MEIPIYSAISNSICPSSLTILPSYCLGTPDFIQYLWPTFKDTSMQLIREFHFTSLPWQFSPRLLQRIGHLLVLTGKTYAKEEQIALAAVWESGMMLYGQKTKLLFRYNEVRYRLTVSIRWDNNVESEDNKKKKQQNDLPVFVGLLLRTITNLIQCWFSDVIGEINIFCLHCYSTKEGTIDPFKFKLSNLELSAAEGRGYVNCRGVVPVSISNLAPDIALVDVNKIHPKDIKLEKKLGEGSFAKVYAGTWKGRRVAIKKNNTRLDR